MRKQIAAANWKMNLTSAEASTLLNEIVAAPIQLKANQQAIFAVPAIYIPLAIEKLANHPQLLVAAQNCHQKTNGAYTGEISATMLASVGIKHIVLGHSERREYFAESDALLAEKVSKLKKYMPTLDLVWRINMAMTSHKKFQYYMAEALKALMLKNCFLNLMLMED